VKFSTADLCDAHPERIRVVDALFQDYGGTRRFSGPVETVRVFEDNALVRSILEQPGEGRILVVDGGGSLRCALLGGRLAAMGQANGWAGLLINGCVRDRAELAAVSIGIRALNTNPMRPSKEGKGTSGIAVSFAGVTFVPGKLLYADDDGILLADQSLL
jgi:regulator of ribonuclease activity A